MLNGRKIESLINGLSISKSDFYKAVNVSKTTMFNIMNGSNSPSVDIIERIADYFKVPIDSLFDRNVEIHIGHNVSGNGNKVSGNIALDQCQKENEHLRELLSEKERTIQILMNQLNSSSNK